MQCSLCVTHIAAPSAAAACQDSRRVFVSECVPYVGDAVRLVSCHASLRHAPRCHATRARSRRVWVSARGYLCMCLFVFLRVWHKCVCLRVRACVPAYAP